MMRGSFELLTMTGANQHAASPSEKRKTLIFRPANVTGNVFLSINPMTAVGQGLLLTPTTVEVRLTFDEDGDIVQRPWFAFGSVATDTIVVMEAMEN